jgi:group I intron endonuclease
MIVYKITNTINGKFYVGKTIQSLAHRFSVHKVNSRNGNTYLYRSIRKHGKENFIVEVIDTASSVEELNEKEVYYIEKLKPEYNMTKGGDGGDTSSSPNWKNKLENGELSLKGADHPNWGKFGEDHPRYGKKMSDEQKIAFSEAHKKKWANNKERKDKARIRLLENNHKSKPITYMSVAYKSIAEAKRLTGKTEYHIKKYGVYND